MMAPLNNERGLVLLVVVILISLLSAVLINQTYRQLIDIRLTETFRDSTRAYYLARGGLEAAQALLQQDNNQYDALDEIWAQPIENIAVGQGTVALEIEAQDGKLDVNRLVTTQGNIDVLERDRLLRLLGVLDIQDPDDKVATLIDWLDPDDDTLLGGAESDYYLAQELSYPARNGKIESLDELRRLRGFSDETVRLLRPHLTIYGSAAINLNTATRPVVLSLHQDLTEAEWESLEDVRKDTPLKKGEEIRDLLGWEPIYLSITPQLGVRSNHYLLLATGQVGNGQRRIEAYYRKSTRALLNQRAF